MADYAISNVARRVVYANTGVGPYAFTFEILANTDIAVYRGSTLLTLTTDYSVTINSNGTGSVTLVTAGTGNITIVGARAIQRTSDYTTGGDLFASTLNTDLDSQTIYVQQVAETAERGLKAPVVDPTDINMTLPSKTDRAGTFLAFDSPSGNPIAGPSIASVGTVTQNIANINTVATNIASVNTVAGNISNVNTVAGISGDVTTVANNNANITTVADDLNEPVSEINTVATNITNVNTVGNNISNVNTVAGSIANVNAVGSNIANVNQVAADTVVINSASANATAAANSATAAATSATNAATSASQASAVALGNEPVRHSVRPSLLLDFANTKQLDPRITFTRSTTGTYYDGKTSALAEQNLLTYSEQFDNIDWTKTNTTVTANSTVAPDGTTTADTLTADGTTNTHGITQTAVASSVGKTFSIYAKAGTNNYLQLYFGGDANPWADFDLSLGTVGSTGTTVTASIVSVGSGWYRCIVTTTSTTATNIIAAIVSSSTATRGQSNSLATTVILWGAQVENRSSVTAYTATTTAPITNYIPVLLTAPANTARFEHNPVTGESLGLEIEEQRTNLITYSSDYTNAAWIKVACTISANTVVAPDGTQTASKVVSDSTNTAHGMSNGGAGTGGTYTWSIYAKAGEYNQIAIEGATGIAGTFTLTGNGTVSGNANASITLVGNGWYRCVAPITVASAFTLYILVYNAGSRTYAGNGFNGVYLWGNQLEAGAFATSYIPTVASQVTRSADSASMTGTNFSSWWNLSQGTFYTEFNYISTAQYSYVIAGQDAASSTRWVETGGGNGIWRTYDGNTLNIGTLAVNTFHKVAVTATQTTNTNCLNGGTVNTGTATGNLLTKTTGLGIGSYNSANFLNGRIKKIAYYPKQLSSAELVGLTTI